MLGSTLQEMKSNWFVCYPGIFISSFLYRFFFHLEWISLAVFSSLVVVSCLQKMSLFPWNRGDEMSGVLCKSIKDKVIDMSWLSVAWLIWLSWSCGVVPVFHMLPANNFVCLSLSSHFWIWTSITMTWEFYTCDSMRQPMTGSWWMLLQRLLSSKKSQIF